MSIRVRIKTSIKSIYLYGIGNRDWDTSRYRYYACC
jgi:hypothetical protein